MTSFKVKNNNGDLEGVPCGKCPACKARRVSAWSFRLMQEEKRSISAHFVTLTYNTKTVPITQRGFMTVKKEDVQKFMKRLRKLETINSNHPLKYYAAAEYGGEKGRPHYHIILFNVHDVFNISRAWSLDEKPIGTIHIDPVNVRSIGYTLKYINKPKKIPAHRNDDRLMEFSLMSKGLGSNYITEQAKTWHYADKNNRMYCTVEDGKKIAMPRYIKNKMYTEEERQLIGNHTRQKMLEKENQSREKYKGDWEADKNAYIEQEISKFQKKKNNDKL